MTIGPQALTARVRTLTVRPQVLTIRVRALTVRPRTLTIRAQPLTVRPQALTNGARRQDDPEHTPLALLALQLDATSVRLDGPACDRETEPDAPHSSRAAHVDPVEALEDPLPMHGRNSRTGVLNVDHALPG